MQSTKTTDNVILFQMKKNVQKLIKYSRKKLLLLSKLELRVNQLEGDMKILRENMGVLRE